MVNSVEGRVKSENLVEGLKLVAQTTKPIVYNKDNVTVMVPIGTLIRVDLGLSIALIGEDHVDVDSDEYSFIN